MKKIELPKSMQKKMNFLSDVCNKHTYWNGTEHIVKPQQMLNYKGEKVCPKCEVEKEKQTLEKALQAEFEENKRLELHNILYKHSLLTDTTILKATFENFLTQQQEEFSNKQKTRDVIERYKMGETFNTVFQGEPGSGKTHLSYSILKELNESDNPNTSCLFVSLEDMLKKIKGSFNNKESKYTEEYFADLLSKVDYLVLDDLGAETGAIESDKSATDFVQRVLYGVMNSRQEKSTIITMNLSGEQLRKRYDSKLISRLLKKPTYIVFKDTKDKRLINTPF